MILNCNTAEDSAQFDAWCDQQDPVIIFKQFYGMSNSEPCEASIQEGGSPLTQVGYITRRIGDTVWNNQVLRTK